MRHELDDEMPIFGDQGDIIDSEERYSFFESVVLEQLSMLRHERDKLLKATDHWALRDMPEMSNEQIVYRQALRDITEHYVSLAEVIWPEKPIK